ncbi:MAG: tetraacyldisaccharide 4'-kinase [Burkholderiales bacterium]|nr:tetraacyldisaccharide 4'-kinase [Burkholderiales bacterium]
MSPLVAAWYAPRRTPVVVLLWPLSLLFRAVVAVRRGLYRRGLLHAQQLPVPVVVIGNVTLGGTGKTPLAIALAEALAARGFRPGFVSRGYGGSAREPRAVAAGDEPALVGDEPPILAASGYPVWIGADRVAAARALLAAHPDRDVLICDDGLQHYRLARRVEIAVIDAARGLGNGLMLPAGPLREPAARLAEVDAVVRLVAGADVRDGHSMITTHVPLPWRNVKDPACVGDPAAWRGREVHAVAGIGNPGRFFAMLRAQGITAMEHAFPDHHPFAPADLAFPGAAAILMTQKDAVKCARFADGRSWYLPVRATVDPALVALVEHKIRGSQAA